MKEKLKLLAANKNFISVSVIVFFIGSVIYFLYAVGFIRPGQSDPLVESASTSLPVSNDLELSDPGAGNKNALELNSALKKQQTTQQKVAVTVSPTKKPTPSVTPKATATSAPTAAPTAAPTTAPTQIPTIAPTTEPTTTPTVAPTEEPTTAPTVEPTSP